VRYMLIAMIIGQPIHTELFTKKVYCDKAATTISIVAQSQAVSQGQPWNPANYIVCYELKY